MGKPKAAGFTVTGTAVALTGTENRGWILYNDSDIVAYLGGPSVTISSGIPILERSFFAPPASFLEQLTGSGKSTGHQLHAITDGSTADLRLLYVEP